MIQRLRNTTLYTPTGRDRSSLYNYALNKFKYFNAQFSRLKIENC
jgi:hypothetical protein